MSRKLHDHEVIEWLEWLNLKNVMDMPDELADRLHFVCRHVVKLSEPKFRPEGEPV